MRTLSDMSPMSRATPGIDRIFDLLEATAQRRGDDYPPYDSIRLDEHRFRLTLAVPGFSAEEVAVTVDKGVLVVSGERRAETEGQYLHRGIPLRVFSRRFPLGEHMDVTAAALANGLLSIELRRELPEADKPRAIPVSNAPDRREPVGQVSRAA